MTRRFYIVVRLDEVPDVMLAWSQREPAEEYVRRVNGYVEAGCQRTIPVTLVEAVVDDAGGRP